MSDAIDKLIQNATKLLASDSDLEAIIIGNLCNYLQIHSSQKICKDNFFDFDFRKDYWWKPEVRLLGAYYLDHFKNDFHAPIEMRRILLELFKVAKTARKNGKFDFMLDKQPFFSKKIFQKLAQELASQVIIAGIDSKSVRDAHPRIFKNEKDISSHFSKYVLDLSKRSEPADMNGGLAGRIQFLPYYLAENEQDLESAYTFLTAYYTLFTSTNAYKVGGAQTFGPIIGNGTTKDFLELIERWFTGATIKQTKFMAHDSSSEAMADKSENVAALELYGFINLHKVPYVNNIVLENYQELFDLEDAEKKVLQEKVGQKVAEFLSTRPEIKTVLTDLWETYIAKAKNIFELHFEPEKITKPKYQEQFRSQLVNDSILSKYKEVLPTVGTNLTPSEKAQAFMHLLMDSHAYAPKLFQPKNEQGTVDQVQYWVVAPGEGAQYWDASKKSGNITIGWDELGDLSRFNDIDEINLAYKKIYKPENNPHHTIRAVHEFSNLMKKGDVLFAKDGRKKLIGVGTVTSDYSFSNKSIHRHTRQVNWMRTGSWELPGDLMFAVKTLTNVSPWPDFVKTLLSISDTNPGIVSVSKGNQTMLPESKNTILWGPPGTGKTYQIIQMQEHFKSISSQKDHLVTWLQKLTWWEAIAAAMMDANKPISVPDLVQHEFIKIKHSTTEAKSINALVWGTLQAHTIRESQTVNVEKRTEPLFLNKSEDSLWSLVGNWKMQLADLSKGLLRIKSNDLDETMEDSRFDMVTFHQSYSYEEFIEGIRPEPSIDGTNISYSIKPGRFMLMCQRAVQNPHQPYAIFIDEINRGNISKIFGELITLLEEDKRLGAENEVKVTLPYSGKEFGVPQNLYVIGTMNSVDRSISLVDMALRRRFDFLHIKPDAKHINADSIPEFDLKSIFKNLNMRISVVLGNEYQIGHSYFMGSKVASLNSFKTTWFKGILPLIQEYLFDDWERIRALVGDFVQETEVQELKNFTLPKDKLFTFVEADIDDNDFIDKMRALE